VTQEADTQAGKPITKTVVVHVVAGRLSGMRRIVGHVLVDAGHSYPPVIPYLGGEAQHAGTFPRYVLYREFKLAAKGQFNNFNPAQV
jgi:hypothetical protein